MSLSASPTAAAEASMKSITTEVDKRQSFVPELHAWQEAAHTDQDAYEERQVGPEAQGLRHKYVRVADNAPVGACLGGR